MKIKVAAIQMNCELANVDANLAKAEALLWNWRKIFRTVVQPSG